MLKVFTGAATLITSASTGIVVSNVIRHNTPKDLKPYERVLTRVGDFVVSGVIADLAANYVEKQINELLSVKLDTTKDNDFEI